MNVVDINKTTKEILLARAVECAGVEYKKSSNFKDKKLKPVCAFANNIMRNEINFLFGGVSEDSSELGGVIPDRVMQNGSNIATIENSSDYQRKVEKLPEKQEKLPEKSGNTTREIGQYYQRNSKRRDYKVNERISRDNGKRDGTAVTCN